MAEHYRRLVAEKTRDALSRLRERGRRVSGHLPFGYTLAPDGLHVVEQPDEQRAPSLIRQLAPGLSLRALSAALVERSVMARCGRPFSAKVLRGVVTDRPVGNSVPA